MRQYTAIFLIALVGATFALKAAESPADLVLGRIDSLVEASRNEQAEQSRIYTNQTQRCKEEKEFRQQEITDASVASGAADQQLQICKTEIPIAQASLAQSQAELQASQNQLNQLVIEYSVYQNANNVRQQEHADAINNIQTAYNIIGNFANGKEALNQGVFVQVSQKLNNIVKIAIKHQFHIKLVPVMTALVQLTQSPATSIPTSSLQRVVQLLRDLEKSIRSSEDSRVKEWADYQKLYDTQTSLLKGQVAALSQIIARYQNYLQNLNSCVGKEQQVYDLASAKLVRNQQILEASIVMCEAFDTKYKQQSVQRGDYIALLGQLRSFVVTAINNYNSGLYKQGDFVHTI